MIKYKEPDLKTRYWVVSLAYTGLSHSDDFFFKTEAEAHVFAEEARLNKVRKEHESGSCTIFFPEHLVCVTIGRHELDRDRKFG